MSRAQASLLVLACLLAAAWAARRVGPALSADVRPTRPVSSSAVPLPAHGILAQAERLRAHLASPPPFRAPSRNPFRFSEPPPPASPVRKKTGPALTTAPVEPAVRADMKLVGIAEDRAADGAIRRTAIVSAMTQLFFAKEGERVLGRYEVVRITPDAAQLKDPDGQLFTITLR
jgi:hypothetical protein